MAVVTQTAVPPMSAASGTALSRSRADRPPVSSRRRMISCSTGSMTTVMTRNWIDHSTVSGAKATGPRTRPPSSWKP